MKYLIFVDFTRRWVTTSEVKSPIQLQKELQLVSEVWGSTNVTVGIFDDYKVASEVEDQLLCTLGFVLAEHR